METELNPDFSNMGLCLAEKFVPGSYLPAHKGREKKMENKPIEILGEEFGVRIIRYSDLEMPNSNVLDDNHVWIELITKGKNDEWLEFTEDYLGILAFTSSALSDFMDVLERTRDFLDENDQKIELCPTGGWIFKENKNVGKE